MNDHVPWSEMHEWSMDIPEKNNYSQVKAKADMTFDQVS
jgi:hypothetical protein